VAVALGGRSTRNAFALSVSGPSTWMAPMYVGDALVGSLPSMVYRMVAPLVDVRMLTVCVEP